MERAATVVVELAVLVVAGLVVAAEVARLGQIEHTRAAFCPVSALG